MISDSHGGKIWQAAQSLKCNINQILDFSSNLNPLGPPNSVQSFLSQSHHLIDLAKHYPDVTQFQLISKLSQKFDVPSDSIVAGNGATELLSRTISLFKNVLIPQPSYGEYCRICNINGITHDFYDWGLAHSCDNQLHKLVSKNKYDLMILCLPNNPTSDLIPLDQLKTLINEHKQITFLIDASFLLFSNKFNLYWEVLNQSNVVVIMSLTKYYCLPGLRIGWAKLNDDLKNRLMPHLDPWSVNAIASQATCLALDDDDYDAKTNYWLENSKKVFIKNLIELIPQSQIKINTIEGIYVSTDMGSTRLKKKIIDELFKNKILVRDCANFNLPTHLRFAIKNESDNQILISKLKEIIGKPIHHPLRYFPNSSNTLQQRGM